MPGSFFAGSTEHAKAAAALGFEGLLIAPSGQIYEAEAFSGPLLQEKPDGLRLAVLLPWNRHRPSGGLAASKPSWFEPQPGADDTVDPRRLRRKPHARLQLERAGTAAAVADWLAEQIGHLKAAGADIVVLTGQRDVPASFFEQLNGRLGADAPTLIEDLTQPGSPAQVDSPFEAGMIRCGEGDSADGLWLFDRPDHLSRTDLMRSLVGARSHALTADAVSSLDPEFIRHLNALRRGHRFERRSPLRRTPDGSLLRFDRDPRRAERVLAWCAANTTSPYRTLGGRFSKMTTLDTTDEGSLAASEAEQRKRPRKAAKGTARLRQLAPERIAIEDVYPLVDGGRFPAKRIVGDTLEIGADIFCDGHEKLAADVILSEPGRDPIRIPLTPKGNDRWTARPELRTMGLASFDIEAWRDQVATWRDEVVKKRAAGQDVRLETIEGRNLIVPQLKEIAGKKGDVAKNAATAREAIEAEDEGSTEQLQRLLDEPLYDLLRAHGDRHQAVRLSEPVSVRVDREQARFSAWYELFPRSMSGTPDRHGTFRDVIDRLPYVKDLGFDVLYFPPIHPIGKTNRKGRNNSLTPEEGDVGSPYAIGSKEGGHDALHPELGTFEDFAALIDAASDHGLEIALDFAIQCSPDHPWLKEHREWFDWRPDGTIKFAENPPKKYEDIVNVHFYRDAIPDLWYALRDVVLFWCEKGVRMFRVDNPHTKPYPFWEWMIGDVKEAYPDALFLSEAFTRPKVMKRLAKLGFTQSYTYFTWRNSKWELQQYLTELTQTNTREVMNPNFFVNTPDINPAVLQTNNRDAYIARTWLAGTLASSYGIYNGVEIAEGTPLPGKEEYLDSEKYEIRAWDMDREGHIKDEIRLLNRLRQGHPALRDHCTLRLLNAYNDNILWYAKATPDLSDVLLFAVSLDFDSDQYASIEIPLWYYGIPDDGSVDARDLMTGTDFTWTGKMQDVTLGPGRIVRAFALKPPAGFTPKDEVLYDDREAF